jgi:hypothetical protein
MQEEAAAKIAEPISDEKAKPPCEAASTSSA